MEAQVEELPEKDFSFLHFYVLEGCMEAGCKSVAFLSIVVLKSMVVMQLCPKFQVKTQLNGVYWALQSFVC